MKKAEDEMLREREGKLDTFQGPDTAFVGPRSH
jgi:hypothetical protein